MRVARFLAVASIYFIGGVSASYNWSHCEAVVKDIRDGITTVGPVNKFTLPNYLYNGTIAGLTNTKLLGDPNYIRITYQGMILMPLPPLQHPVYTRATP